LSGRKRFLAKSCLRLVRALGVCLDDGKRPRRHGSDFLDERVELASSHQAIGNRAWNLLWIQLAFLEKFQVANPVGEGASRIMHDHLQPLVNHTLTVSLDR